MKQQHGISVRWLALVVLLMTLTVSVARGNTITFFGLSGANGAPLAPYTEGTFTVTPTLGSWFQGQGYGNPLPSIFDGPIGSPGNATIEVTDSAGLFTFGAVDYSSNNGTSGFDIMGFRGGVLQFDQSGTLVASLPPLFGFTTLPSGFSTKIDTLFVEVLPGSGVTSINLDNINVTTVPEPATLTTLAMGLLGGIGFLRRRRSL